MDRKTTALYLLKQEFTAEVPDLKWGGDIIHFATGEEWFYLAMLIDLHLRKLVGWSVNERMTRDIRDDGFNML